MSSSTGYVCGKCGHEPDIEELNRGTCSGCRLSSGLAGWIQSIPKTRSESWPDTTTDDSDLMARYNDLLKRRSDLEVDLEAVDKETSAIKLLIGYNT